METPSNPRRLAARMILASSAALLTLLAAETALRIADQPRFPEAHTETRRFMLTEQKINGMPVYLNYPGTITFTYADNPRGYFDKESRIHHEVNEHGFRGRHFGPKQDGVSRLIFLGDSFTFGEGVRLEHTYPEITAKYLSMPQLTFEPCNLGVGGYNTSQSEVLLKGFGFSLLPDAVILGYVPNDAETPLFSIEPAAGRPVRRNREALIEAEGKPQTPPPSFLYRLRTAQLIWKAHHKARLTKQTVSYYNSLYTQESEGWIESQRAMRSIIAMCHEKNIPCIVVLFPILHDLSDDYPFAEIHDKVGAVVKDAGGTFIDLLPSLKGKNAQKLWVHPTDQHPNERVHAIAGEKVANALREELNHE